MLNVIMFELGIGRGLTGPYRLCSSEILYAFLAKETVVCGVESCDGEDFRPGVFGD